MPRKANFMIGVIGSVLNSPLSAGRKTMRWLMFLIGVFGSSFAYAEQVHINMITNADDKEISSLSATCDRQAYTMTCQFTQVMVRSPLSDIEKAEKVENIFKEIVKDKKSFTSSKVCQKEMRAKFLAELSHGKNDSSDNREVTSRTEALFGELFKACDNPTNENARAWASKSVDADNKVCNIMQLWPFDLTFNKQLDGSWLSNSGPTGSCGAINIVKMWTDEGRDSLWNYEGRRIYTNRNGSPDGMCQKLEESTQIFNWKSGSKIRRCDMIGFGLW